MRAALLVKLPKPGKNMNPPNGWSTTLHWGCNELDLDESGN